MPYVCHLPNRSPLQELHKISNTLDSFSHAGRIGEHGEQVYAAYRTFDREEQ